MGIIKKGLGAAAFLTAACTGETLYFYNRTMKRQNAKTERTMKMSGTDWSQYAPFIAERSAYMMAQPHEDVSQTSFDGLKLHATYFPAPEGSDSAKKAVICFHGYTGEGLSNHAAIAQYFLKRGYAMLLPDARAHGESEGKYIGFGYPDRQDAVSWIHWLIGEAGEDIEILLFGTSMGGSTVLMASGLTLPPQVKGIVSDCGFTSAKDVFTHTLNSTYHLPAFPAIPGANLLHRKLAGYGIDLCDARQEVAKATVPILFIHGSADTFVPARMCDELYDRCTAPKQKLIIPGAAHAESYYKDTDAYEQALTSFTEDIF